MDTSLEKQPAKMTPLMHQYWDVKSAHEDKVVLFRMGDFFEMFHSDAETAAPVLGIALTSRNKKSENPEPMCGVPHHSVAGSINKLLAAGFKVAICDQIEDPKLAKGLVKRAVTRILSPGVVFDPDTLDSMTPNYIASVDSKAVSFLDTTTGEAFYFMVKDESRRLRLLASLQPVEIITTSEDKSQISESLPLTMVTAHETLGPAFGDWPESARRVLGYAIHMQGEKILETLAPFERRELLDRMEVPANVLRHLEIFETYKGDANGSLFHAVNRCKTSAGARMLKSWLQFPLTNHEAIERRFDLVERWSKGAKLKSVRAALGGLGDIQRRLGKLGSPSCNPRDLIALADSLEAGLEVCQQANEDVWDDELTMKARKVAREIRTTLVDEPPLQTKNGGLIRKGVDGTLDELIELSTNSHELIMQLEAREKELTGISSLKIRFNNVFGYYIEITNTHKDKVPTDRYDRKQTLANAERYLTPELAELETKVLSAQSKRLELELSIFSMLVASCLKDARSLLTLANKWSEIDVITSFAALATEQSYSRPRLSLSRVLSLRSSRHPVIEQSLSLPFVANDIMLNAQHTLLLTGPNMAGKSTLMRQVAVASLLAQCGSFIPAKPDSALPVFDRIFTRIGASDFLSEGLSTFMVEMKETAEMLAMATENSLVILDEVGRGTSTYDGLSLAQAILEFLISEKKCMTLFATHYHELTDLAALHPELINAHMSIHEESTPRGPVIRFLHQLVKGPANKSYGIHVGRLAGLPASVTKRATQILRRLESGRSTKEASQMSMMGLLDEPATSFLNEVANGRDVETQSGITELPPVVNELVELDISKLTPLEALNQIARWQQSLS
jgi:DNA mismatch repair protein MutS